MYGGCGLPQKGLGQQPSAASADGQHWAINHLNLWHCCHHHHSLHTAVIVSKSNTIHSVGHTPSDAWLCSLLALATNMRRVCVSMLHVTGRTSIQASRHIGVNSVRLLSLLPHYDARLSSLLPVTNISMCKHAERVMSSSLSCSCCLCCLWHPQVNAWLSKLRDALRQEVKLAETLQLLSGCLEPILAAALTGSATTIS